MTLQAAPTGLAGAGAAAAAPRPEWLARACRLPVAFAQVREDPRQDLWLALRQHRMRGAALRIALTASGGCTAATLAGCSAVGALHLVDANPAQLALTRLKLHLLQTVGGPERMRLLGHAPMRASQRHAALAAVFAGLDLELDVLGPAQEVAVLRLQAAE